MAPADLDLASLDILLQRVRRHPRDRALRLAAARDVAVLADQAARGGDKLLQEAGSIARMLQRALDRSNKAAVADEADLAAVNAWIDTLHGQLLRAITR
jgi:hypothetical protein